MANPIRGRNTVCLCMINRNFILELARFNNKQRFYYFLPLNKVLQDIAAGRKEKACTEATQLVVRVADIDGSIITNVLALLNQIRKRRGAGPFFLPNIL